MNLDSCQLNILTFSREEVMKHIPPRCYRGLHTDWKVTVWDSSIDPLPHQPTKNTGCAPSLWLSIFHLCTLSACPSCLLCLIITIRETSKSPVDTASSTASASWRRGFTALFWPGWRYAYAPTGGGGYPTAEGACTETAGPARAEVRFVYQLSDFSQRVNKVFFFPFHTEALQWNSHGWEEKGHPPLLWLPRQKNEAFYELLCFLHMLWSSFKWVTLKNIQIY